MQNNPSLNTNASSTPTRSVKFNINSSKMSTFDTPTQSHGTGTLTASSVSPSLPPLSLAGANTNSLSTRFALQSKRRESSPRHARLTHIEPTPQTSPDCDEQLEQTLHSHEQEEQEEQEEEQKQPTLHRAKTAFSIFGRSRLHEKNKKANNGGRKRTNSSNAWSAPQQEAATHRKRAKTVSSTAESSKLRTRFKRAHTLQHLAQFIKGSASGSGSNEHAADGGEREEEGNALYRRNTAIQELESFVREGNVQGIIGVCASYEHQAYPTFFMDYSNEQGHTLLMRAAFLGHFTVLKYLINRYKKYKAAIFESVEPTMGKDVACLLLEYMGDYLNYESMGGKSALIFACSCKHKSRLNTVKYLLESGASVTSPKHSKHGKSPLIHAVEWKQEKLLELLLDYGADVNVQDSNNGFTPLMYAAKFNNRDLCEFLLERGADKSLKNKHGKTAVQLAKMDQCWASLLALDVSQIPANVLSLAATSPSKNRWGRYSASYSYF